MTSSHREVSIKHHQDQGATNVHFENSYLINWKVCVCTRVQYLVRENLEEKQMHLRMQLKQAECKMAKIIPNCNTVLYVTQHQ